MPKGDPGGGGPTSMLQGLQVVLGQLGSLMAAPDADPKFLVQLQMAITGKIKQGTQQAIQGQQQQAMGGGMGPQRIGPGGGAGMSGFGGAAPAMGAGAGQPQGQPNPDEMRRVMGAQGMTQ